MSNYFYYTFNIRDIIKQFQFTNLSVYNLFIFLTVLIVKTKSVILVDWLY